MMEVEERPRQSIPLTAKTQEDGALAVSVPTLLKSATVDVTVVFSPAPRPMPDDWQDFIKATAGRWEGEPLEREDQGDYPERVFFE